MLADWIIGLHLLSLHHPATYVDDGVVRRYERETHGVYARAPNCLTLGAYRNSYGDPALYVGCTLQSKSKTFALLLGGVVGYERAAVLPLVIPSVRIALGRDIALRIAGAPRFEKGGASVLHIAAERSF